MKKISKGYYIAAALLVIWAMVDLYHYFTVGPKMLPRYPDSPGVWPIVHDNILQGIGKVLLAAMIIAIGWWRAKKKNSIRSITAVSLLLIISIMGTWLVSMVTLTVVTAQEI